MVEKLKRKGFFWCMVNQDKIDIQIADVEMKITMAFGLFNVSQHLSFIFPFTEYVL